MIFYFSFFFGCLISFAIYYDKYLKIISNKIIFTGICFLFIFFVGFRYNSGTDYWSYYKIFNGTHEKKLASEFGYQFLIKYFKKYSSSFNGFIFFIAFVSIFIKYLFFKKLENPFLALFIYITIFSINLEFNGMRQGLAASFVFFAIYWAKKRNFIAFFIFIILASSIHISSLVFFPLYFFISRNITITTISVLAIIIIAFIFRFYLMRIILTAMQPSMERISGLEVIGRVVFYLKIKDISLKNLGAIRRIAMCILFLFLNNHKKINNTYFNLYLISVIIYILFMGYNIIAYRLSLVFDIFLIPLFANIKFTYNFKNISIITVLITISFVLFLITLQSESQNLVPYQTYLF